MMSSKESFFDEPGGWGRRSVVPSRCLTWTFAAAAMIVALLWPALWNGFSIVSDDTGGYLARPFEHTLLFGRSALYGAFLAM